MGREATPIFRRQVDSYLSNTPDLVQHGAEDLADEIRSVATGKPCYGPNEWGTECGQYSKCKSASAEPKS
jgi:hypothetical protein